MESRRILTRSQTKLNSGNDNLRTLDKSGECKVELMKRAENVKKNILTVTLEKESNRETSPKQSKLSDFFVSEHSGCGILSEERNKEGEKSNTVNICKKNTSVETRNKTLSPHTTTLKNKSTNVETSKTVNDDSTDKVSEMCKSSVNKQIDVNIPKKRKLIEENEDNNSEEVSGKSKTSNNRTDTGNEKELLKNEPCVVLTPLRVGINKNTDSKHYQVFGARKHIAHSCGKLEDSSMTGSPEPQVTRKSCTPYYLRHKNDKAGVENGDQNNSESKVESNEDQVPHEDTNNDSSEHQVHEECVTCNSTKNGHIRDEIECTEIKIAGHVSPMEQVMEKTREGIICQNQFGVDNTLNKFDCRVQLTDNLRKFGIEFYEEENGEKPTDKIQITDTHKTFETESSENSIQEDPVVNVQIVDSFKQFGTGSQEKLIDDVHTVNTQKKCTVESYEDKKKEESRGVTQIMNGHKKSGAVEHKEIDKLLNETDAELQDTQSSLSEGYKSNCEEDYSSIKLADNSNNTVLPCMVQTVIEENRFLEDKLNKTSVEESISVSLTVIERESCTDEGKHASSKQDSKNTQGEVSNDEVQLINVTKSQSRTSEASTNKQCISKDESTCNQVSCSFIKQGNNVDDIRKNVSEYDENKKTEACNEVESRFGKCNETVQVNVDKHISLFEEDIREKCNSVTEASNGMNNLSQSITSSPVTIEVNQWSSNQNNTEVSEKQSDQLEALHNQSDSNLNKKKKICTPKLQESCILPREEDNNSLKSGASNNSMLGDTNEKCEQSLLVARSGNDYHNFSASQITYDCVEAEISEVMEREKMRSVKENKEQCKSNESDKRLHIIKSVSSVDMEENKYGSLNESVKPPNCSKNEFNEDGISNNLVEKVPLVGETHTELISSSSDDSSSSNSSDVIVIEEGHDTSFKPNSKISNSEQSKDGSYLSEGYLSQIREKGHEILQTKLRKCVQQAQEKCVLENNLECSKEGIDFFKKPLKEGAVIFQNSETKLPCLYSGHNSISGKIVCHCHDRCMYHCSHNEMVTNYFNVNKCDENIIESCVMPSIVSAIDNYICAVGLSGKHAETIKKQIQKNIRSIKETLQRTSGMQAVSDIPSSNKKRKNRKKKRKEKKNKNVNNINHKEYENELFKKSKQQSEVRGTMMERTKYDQNKEPERKKMKLEYEIIKDSKAKSKQTKSIESEQVPKSVSHDVILTGKKKAKSAEGCKLMSGHINTIREEKCTSGQDIIQKEIHGIKRKQSITEQSRPLKVIKVEKKITSGKNVFSVCGSDNMNKLRTDTADSCEKIAEVKHKFTFETVNMPKDKLKASYSQATFQRKNVFSVSGSDNVNKVATDSAARPKKVNEVKPKFTVETVNLPKIKHKSSHRQPAFHMVSALSANGDNNIKTDTIKTNNAECRKKNAELKQKFTDKTFNAAKDILKPTSSQFTFQSGKKTEIEKGILDPIKLHDIKSKEYVNALQEIKRNQASTTGLNIFHVSTNTKIPKDKAVENRGASSTNTENRESSLRRLPEELLEAVSQNVIEKKSKRTMSGPSDSRVKPSKQKKKLKLKSAVLEDGYIPLNTDSATQFVVARLDKQPTLSAAEEAAQFKQNHLYGQHIKRAPVKREYIMQKLQLTDGHH